MITDVIPAQDFEICSANNIIVEPINEMSLTLIKNLIYQNNPENRKVPLDAAYIFCVQLDDSKRYLGVINLEKNDVRTKYDISEEDKVPKNYHEITYLLIDERIFQEDILSNLLKKVFDMSVSKDDIDEVFWMSYLGLFSKIINKVFKTCDEYYFQNEADYFASNIISTYKQLKDSWLSQIMSDNNRTENAPE